MTSTLLTLFQPSPDVADKTLLETRDGKLFSYRDFFALSARLANTLKALGVSHGDRVAVQVDKSPEALALYVACIRAGAVYLPLNTAYTASEIDYFVGDAEPALLVCRPDGLEELRPVAARVAARCETLDEAGGGSLMELAASQPSTFIDHEAGSDDLAAILYTSGTTGRSKGAMLTHGNLVSNALTLAEYWRFTANDVLLHALPIYHTHGLFVATNVVLAARASMLFLPRFDADIAISLLPRASVMMGVPTFYTRLLEHPGLTRERVGHMRLFISGSAPLLKATHDEFSARTGHAILERYGMTETNMNTSNPYDGDRIAGTVGFPLPDISVRIADPETGELLGTDEIGMIEVKGPNVFKGYWCMPEKTDAEFRQDGFFITGDLGRIDRKGYVHIVGRGKDLVITGGFNVYPKEIELMIDAVEGVHESAVIGIPHPDFGEGVTAVVVPEPGVTLTEDQIMASVADRLAKFKQPKRILFADDLPRNSMGKVQKNLLREKYHSLYGGTV